MGKASDNKKKKCVTVIPQSWPRFTGPEYKDGMDVERANELWRAFLRMHSTVRPTPKVYRKDVGF